MVIYWAMLAWTLCLGTVTATIVGGHHVFASALPRAVRFAASAGALAYGALLAYELARIAHTLWIMALLGVDS